MVIWIIAICSAALLLLLSRKRGSKSHTSTINVATPPETDVVGKTTVVLRSMKIVTETPDVSNSTDEKEVKDNSDNVTEQTNLLMSLPLTIDPEEDNPNEEEEELPLPLLSGDTFASGATFEELELTYDVICNRKREESDSYIAARIISSEACSDIFTQMVEQVPQGIERVAALLEKYLPKAAYETDIAESTGYNEFDISNIL